MHVAAGFMPAFKYRQKNSLIVFERGHKAHGYVSAGKASKIPTGGPPMTTRLSVTGDLLIWTGLVIDRRYSQGSRSLSSSDGKPRHHWRATCWNFRGLSSGHVAVGFMPAFKHN